MRPDGVVVDPPVRQGLAGMGERGEQGLVQALVAQPAVEALDEGVLLRLAWRDVVPVDAAAPATSCRIAMLVSSVPLSETIIVGRPRAGDERIELARDPQARQRGVGDQRQALAGEVVDDRQDAEAPAVGEARPTRSRATSAGSAPAAASSAPACPAPACGRRAGAPAAVPRDRAAGASCGSCACPRGPAACARRR